MDVKFKVHQVNVTSHSCLLLLLHPFRQSFLHNLPFKIVRSFLETLITSVQFPLIVSTTPEQFQAALNLGKVTAPDQSVPFFCL